MKKNVYLAQPSYKSSNSVPFPAAIGALAAYAWSLPEIEEYYNLRDILFLREKPAVVVALLEAPAVFGFSCYMWNIEYNKVLAKLIKEAFPLCVIVFGGPQVQEGSALLRECPYIDVLIHGEGELAFAALLSALKNDASLRSVSGLSFREGESYVNIPQRVCCKTDFPSPITSGFFDRLISEHQDLVFTPIVESSRGCPSHCAYCSWGSKETGIRLFPMERVYGDLQWISMHKMEYVGFVDSNFGMFPRDEKIADRILELHQKNGYPQKFQVSYAKDSSDRVFNITKKLNDAGLCKGVTLSFQTMSKEAQKNIGRSNIDIEYYRYLLQRYAEAGIVTYSELILGLPGETAESFIDGIEQLLEYGQHAQMMIHLCEWLPLSPMGEQTYLDKYKIKYIRIPLNQPHYILNESDGIPEYSHIVVSTYSMTEAQWKQVALFSMCVLCFHHLGLMQLPALYLFFEKGIKYVDFYSILLDWLLDKGDSVFNRIDAQLDAMLAGKDGAVILDERFGRLSWTLEEYAYLSIVYRKEVFYREMDMFLASFIPDNTFRREMLAFQDFTIKGVGRQEKEFLGCHDWRAYYRMLRRNRKIQLQERSVRYVIHEKNMYNDWPEYAQKVVWYGRRGGNNVYEDEITEESVDE